MPVWVTPVICFLVGFGMGYLYGYSTKNPDGCLVILSKIDIDEGE